MKTLSYWAKRNPVKARFLIAFSRITLAILGSLFGLWLEAEGYMQFKGILLLSALTFLAGYSFYPILLKGQSRKASFVRRKCCDGLLVASSLLFYVGVGNYAPQWADSPVPSSPSATVSVAKSMLSKKTPDLKWYKSNEKKTFRKMKAKLKKDIRELKKGAKDLPPWKVALLILATVGIVIGLGFMVATLSCAIACNDQEGLAVVVLIGGVALIIWACIALWRRAIRRQKERERLLQMGEKLDS